MAGIPSKLRILRTQRRLEREIKRGKIRAELLKEAITELGEGSSLIYVPVIEGVPEVVIEGLLNLASMSLPTLVLHNCRFDILRLDDSHAPRIELQGCRGREISAKGLVVEDGFTLADVTVTSTVDLNRARIAQRLIVKIRDDIDSGEEKHLALKCHHVKVGSDVDVAFDKCDIREVGFVCAEIEGTFTCTGQLGYRGQGALECKDRVALRCNGMQVQGSLLIGDPNDKSRTATIDGEVNLVNANIKGDVNFTNAQITNPVGRALDAKHLTVGRDLYLSKGFKADGVVRLTGARVTRLLCTGGTFHNKCGPAIDADGLVAVDVFFNSEENEEKKFVAEGSIRLEGAQISRQLRCSRAEITIHKARSTEDTIAIDAQHIVTKDIYFDRGCNVSGGTIELVEARVDNGVYFEGTFKAPNGSPVVCADAGEFGRIVLRGDFTGKVSLMAATVGRDLNCTGCKLSNPQGYALKADRLTCGALYLDREFKATGLVCLWGATVTYVDCRKGKVLAGKAPKIEEEIEENTCALDLTKTKIEGHLLAQGVEVEGGLSLADAYVSGDLDFTGASITPTGKGTVLNGYDLVVDETFSWQLAKPPMGKINLSDAKVGRLRDDLRTGTSWPKPDSGRKARQAFNDLNLSGFRYGTLEEEEKTAVRERLEWLASAKPFSQQPYEELARTYQGWGRSSDATKVRLEEQKERTRRAGLPLLEKWWNYFLEVMVGYGYRPRRILISLVVIAVTGAFLFHRAEHQDAMEAVGWRAPAPCDELPPKERAKLSPSEREKLPPPCKITAEDCTPYYPCFSPPVYAVELLIPVINFRQIQYWLPYRSQPWFFWLTWIPILFGWLAVTALAAGLSRVWR